MAIPVHSFLSDLIWCWVHVISDDFRVQIGQIVILKQYPTNM
ncbi:unnamed protein product [Brassica rapa subsp. trilocularis]